MDGLIFFMFINEKIATCTKCNNFVIFVVRMPSKRQKVIHIEKCQNKSKNDLYTNLYTLSTKKQAKFKRFFEQTFCGKIINRIKCQKSVKKVLTILVVFACLLTGVQMWYTLSINNNCIFGASR